MAAAVSAHERADKHWSVWHLERSCPNARPPAIHQAIGGLQRAVLLCLIAKLTTEVDSVGGRACNHRVSAREEQRVGLDAVCSYWVPLAHLELLSNAFRGCHSILLGAYVVWHLLPFRSGRDGSAPVP